MSAGTTPERDPSAPGPSGAGAHPAHPSHLTPRGEFLRGVRMSTSAVIGVSIWGLVVGVAMVKIGLSIPQIIGMTLIVYAGSAQLASLPLIAAGVPVWVVLFSTLVINLRFLIYSAVIAPWLKHVPARWRPVFGYASGDVSATLFLQEVQTNPGRPHREWFYFAPSLMGWTSWQVATVAGVVLATNVPEAWGLDLAGTIALAGTGMVAVTNLPAAAGVVSAGIVGLLGAGLPLRLGLIAAVVVGVSAALAVEVLIERRKQASANRAGAGS